MSEDSAEFSDSTASLHGQKVFESPPSHPALKQHPESVDPQEKYEILKDEYLERLSSLASKIRKNQALSAVINQEFAQVFNKEVGSEIPDDFPVSGLIEVLHGNSRFSGMSVFTTSLGRILRFANENGITNIGELRRQENADMFGNDSRVKRRLRGDFKETAFNFLKEGFKKPTPNEDSQIA